MKAQATPTSKNDSAIAGPAPGRPNVGEWWIRYSSKGAFRMDEAWNFWPAIAVPITVKIPDPITAPMPSAVRLQGPRLFLSRCSGSSASAISLSMDLVARSWLGSQGSNCSARRRGATAAPKY